jgi:DNA topoisomerase-1
MTASLDSLEELYSDNKTCARLVGLTYIEAETEGLRRQKRGKGFIYKDTADQVVADAKLKQRIAELVIPPAWQEVWICPSAKGHILATGIDEKGRKQYLYHPKWRTMRDLIKFYRMIVFARALPKIRREIETHLQHQDLSREKVLAAMLWILDNVYIRIGNEAYYQQNESVGLTTLTDKNIMIAGSVVTLAFKGKSGKEQQITFDEPRLARTLTDLCGVKGERLFRYRQGNEWRPLEADDINAYLHELTSVQISAKDFRTWGGTLMAFLHLVEEYEAEQSPKPEKVVVEAVDQAAAILGNTRTVARSAYVHPHLLATYGSKNFARYYKKSKQKRKVPGLDRAETELLYFLEQLFAEEFKLLRDKQGMV